MHRLIQNGEVTESSRKYMKRGDRTHRRHTWIEVCITSKCTFRILIYSLVANYIFFNENAEPMGAIAHTCTKVVVHREYKMKRI